MSCPDFTRILFIVIEILVGKRPVPVADQSIAADT
jgi:hypothetical protein